MLTTFTTILAWIFGPICTFIFICCMVGIITYDENTKLLDTLKGVERTYPWGRWFIGAIICWAWIFTVYLGE